ncbi:MAG: hypothetical protein KF721_08885 [Ignavibacteriaceae bacterium]|nr:hypothetical protein [Ignavibacteriaceae bacterium]HRI46216.1 hypothetical protein [Ignavibacteriaceae bacterium]
MPNKNEDISDLDPLERCSIEEPLFPFSYNTTRLLHLSNLTNYYSADKINSPLIFANDITLIF